MRVKGKNKLAWKLAFMAVLLSVFFLFFILSNNTPDVSNKELIYIDILDEKKIDLFDETQYVLTVKINNTLSIQDCFIKKGGESLSKAEEVFNRGYYAKTLEYKNHEILLNSSNVITRHPEKVLDLDDDGVLDDVFLCTKDYCPKSFVDKGIIVNLSAGGKHVFLKLKSSNGSLIDMSRPEQHVNIDYVKAINDNIRLSIDGKTSSMPNVLGLNEERISFINNFYSVAVDLDNDNVDEIFSFDRDGIVIFFSKDDSVFRGNLLAENESSRKEKLLVDGEDYGSITIKENKNQEDKFDLFIKPAHPQDRFLYEPIMNGSIKSGELYRVFFYSDKVSDNIGFYCVLDD